MVEGGIGIRRIIKIVLIGENAVGKTSLRQVYVGKKYQERCRPTLGVDFSVKEDVMATGEGWQWQIWDLAGAPNYRPLQTVLYFGAVGAMVVYDLANPVSLTRLPFWVNELYAGVKTAIPLLVVGNKTDLRETGTPCLTTEHGTAVVRQLQEHFGLSWIGFIETSAKTATNVTKAFDELRKLILVKLNREERETKKALVEVPPAKTKSKEP
ncbi:MAG: Rab family GTPase [Promethearchaeota archaeon]